MNSNNYTIALNPALAKRVAALDDDAREFYEERAGIFEYEAGNPRAKAEYLAWKETEQYLARRKARL